MRTSIKVRTQKIRIIVGDQDSLFAVGKKLEEGLTEMKIRHGFFPVHGSPHNHDQLMQYETFDTMASSDGVRSLAQRRSGSAMSSRTTHPPVWVRPT